MTRHQRRRVAYGVAAATSFALICLVAHLQFRAALAHAVDRQLDYVAGSTAQRLSALLSGVDARLRQLRDQDPRSCSGPVLRELQAIAYEIEGVREAGVFADGVLRCTSWGVLAKPIPLSSGDGDREDERIRLLPLDGSAFGFSGRNVLANLGLDTSEGSGGVNALIEPGYLMPFAEGPGSAVTVRIRRPPDMTLASYGPHPEATAARGYYRSLTIEDSAAPFSVDAWISREDALMQAGALRLATEGVGVLVAVLAAAAILLIGRRRLELSAELGVAVRRGEFFYEYQPICDIQQGGVAAVEALLRWRHPDLGIVEPNRFIAYCEETGHIQDITLGLVSRLSRDLGDLMHRHRHVDLHLNLGAPQLSERALRQLAAAFEAVDLSLQRVVFEVTERHLLAHGQSEAQHGFQREFSIIQSLGCRLAIDDFGTGYCGMAYLKLFPFDTVKVDRMFLQCPPDPERSRLLGEALLFTVNHLELLGVAEGVETDHQLRLLREMGVRYAQGYLLAHPMDAGALAAFLDQAHAPLRNQSSPPA